MVRYVCPEGDHEQEMPGMCPNHGIELVEMSDEGTEEKEGMEEDMEEKSPEEMGTMPEEEEGKDEEEDWEK